MKRPTLQSHNVSNARLDLYATGILNGMLQNGDVFSSPTPSLGELERALVDFRTAVADAAHRDQRAILLRNQKRKELFKILRLLSFYVSRVADGNESIILLSGFIPSKDPVNSGDNPKPSKLRAKPEIGLSGIDLSVAPWRPARMYQFEYRKKGSTDPWSVQLSSKSRCRITGLERFAEYEFRVSYIGRTARLLYSDIIYSYVY